MKTKFLCMVMLTCTLHADYDKSALKSILTNLDNEYNIKIHHKYSKSTYFPQRWHKEPINAKGGQLSDTEIKRLVPLSKKFLSRYSSECIHKNLKNIFLLSELEFYGKSYGATNSRDSVYIKSKGVKRGFTNRFLEGIMHSEFSSILLRNHKFPKLKWKQTNRDSFSYVGSGRAMLGEKDLYGTSEQLHIDGFLVKYSQSSLENDVNMYVDWIFTKPNELEKLAKKYPKIKIKKELVLKFYEDNCDLKNFHVTK